MSTGWAPTTTGVYKKETNSAYCYFDCNEHYSWNEGTSTCDADTETVYCDDTTLPANAEWKGADAEGKLTIQRTWNGSAWDRTTSGTWNDGTEVTDYCYYQCKEDYHRVGNTCVYKVRESDCLNGPDGTLPNNNGTVTQTWTLTTNDRWKEITEDKWVPSNASLNPTYSASAVDNECHFKCRDGYTYDTTNGKCPYCGDNNQDAPETCDEGSSNGTGYGHCNATCNGTLKCGDGVIQNFSSEVCATIPGCTVVANANEKCDSGTANSNDWADSSATKHCKADCSGMAPYCGDGNIDTGNEQCDSAYAPKCENYSYYESTLGTEYGTSGSTFIYSGTIQEYPVPASGIYKITAIGAAGGNGYGSRTLPG